MQTSRSRNSLLVMAALTCALAPLGSAAQVIPVSRESSFEAYGYSPWTNWSVFDATSQFGAWAPHYTYFPSQNQWHYSEAGVLGARVIAKTELILIDTLGDMHYQDYGFTTFTYVFDVTSEVRIRIYGMGAVILSMPDIQEGILTLGPGRYTYTLVGADSQGRLFADSGFEVLPSDVPAPGTLAGLGAGMMLIHRRRR